MNLRKKKELLALLKQYKRSSRGRLKQYTVDDPRYKYKNLHKDVDYFEKVGIDKIFKSIIKFIENKMKPFNDILKFDLKVIERDNFIINKYHDYNKKIVNKLDLSNKEKSTIMSNLIELNYIGIVVNYGLKNITPHIWVEAPRSSKKYKFKESESKKLVADVQKDLMKTVNDTLNDIIKISKKIKIEN